MRIAIVGAGPGGLAAAHSLVTQGTPRAEIVVLEGGNQAGGLAQGFRGHPDWEWSLERFYHHLFTNDTDIIRFTHALGLSDLLEFHSPTTTYYYQGCSYRLDSMGSLLGFPHLTLAQKLRMGLVIAYLRWHPRPPWPKFDAVTAHAWLQSRMGTVAYTTLWQSLLEGKFGRRYRDVPLAWFAARIRKRTADLGYFRGGFQAWADAVSQAIQALGVRVEFHTQVRKIHPAPQGFTIRTSRQTWQADAVLYTGSPASLGRCCDSLPPSYVRQLGAGDFMGAVVLTVALDRSLTQGTYWISVPANAGLPFLALVEHTAMIPPVRYGGHHMVYAGAYVETDHRYLALPEEVITQEILAGFTAIHPAFDPSWVQGTWLHRTPYAQPIPYPGAGSRRLPWQTPLPGLYLATMSQVWPWDRGTNYAVQLGQDVADLMARDLNP